MVKPSKSSFNYPSFGKNSPFFDIFCFINYDPLKPAVLTTTDSVMGLKFGRHLLNARNIESPLIRGAFMQLKEYLDGSRQIFDLGRDYGKIKANIRAIGDPYLTAAVDYGYGIRILRQELWETIVTFLISQ